MTLSDHERARGVMLGLACGDALGRPVEFKPPEAIEDQYGVLDEMVGGGTWGQPPGTLSDDTEQALCIARSLVERGGFDGADIADRFLDWYATDPFDVGGMTRRAFERLNGGDSWQEAGQTVWEASVEGENAGNGSVMRSPPLAIPYRDYPAAIHRVSQDTSRITHADPRCTVGTSILNVTIAACFRDEVDEPLAIALGLLEDDDRAGSFSGAHGKPILGGGTPDELHDALDTVPDEIDEGALETSGYVVHSLQTALYDALTADSTKETIVSAVNRGGDTDTIGAIAGAVAGARHGPASLPKEWLDVLDHREELTALADDLATLID